MLLILGKLILNIYAAESRTTDCRKFRTHRTLCQLRTNVLYAVDKGLRGRNFLKSVALDSATNVSAHDQFIQNTV